jgi:hypothetical protein
MCAGAAVAGRVGDVRLQRSLPGICESLENLNANNPGLDQASFEYIESWFGTSAGSTAPSGTAVQPPTKPPSTRTPPPRRHDLAPTLSVEPGQAHLPNPDTVAPESDGR